MKLAHALAVAAVLITAAFLRFYGLGWLPPGLFHDEAAIGLDALDILGTGQLPIYFERTTGGQEPLFGYLTTLSFLALGPSVLAMRVVAPMVGLLTVAVTYALGKEMHGKWVGLVAALLMAVSYWHVHVSHTSFRAITLPLLTGLTFLLLWRALKTGAIWRYALAGLSGAATMYTYQSSRLFPLLLALAFVYLLACGPRRGSRTGVNDAARGVVPGSHPGGGQAPALHTWGDSGAGQAPAPHMKGDPSGGQAPALHLNRECRVSWAGVAAFAAVMALCTAPLVWYYLNNPAIFSARIDQVGMGGEGVWEGLSNTLGMFSLQGDITWKFNLPGKPVFDPLVSGLFYLGAIVSLRRWHQPSYGLLPLWVAIMLLPTILSTESPHFLRAMGVMPAVYLLPGIGVVWLVGAVGRWAGALADRGPVALACPEYTAQLIVRYRGFAARYRELAARYREFAARYGKLAIGFRKLGGSRSEAFAYLALAAWLAFGAAATYRAYFGEWAGSPQAYDVYNGDVEDAARYLNSLDGSQVAMFSTRYYRHYTVLFVERRPLDLRWFDGRQSLPLPEPDGREVVYIFPASAMPAKGFLDGILGPGNLAKEGRGPQGQLAFLAYRLSPESLAAARSRLVPPKLVSGRIGSELELLGYQVGNRGSRPEVRPGEILPLTLYWRVLQGTDADYSFFSHLLDKDARMWGQGDSNEYWSSEWRPGDLVVGRYDLQVDPGAPPGRFTAEVGVFDRRTGQRLGVSGGGEGQVLEAVKVAQLGRPPGDAMGRVLGARFGEAIELRGFSLEAPGATAQPSAPVRAGERLDVSLFWRASGPVQDDYTVFLHLLDSSGHMVAQADSQPQGGAFPTSFWDPGEVVGDRVQLSVPANTPPGSYDLRVGLYLLASGRRLPASGGSALGDQVSLGRLEVVAP